MKNPFLDDAPLTASLTRNPFLDEDAASTGVTIAPKGGVARMAADDEAGQVNYSMASAGDVATKAAENLIPSARRFGSDIMSVVTDPVGTVKTLGKVGLGAAQKLIPGEQEQEPYADAVGQFFANRYGGMDAFKKTMAEDPVGFAADVATVLTGGQLALARAPGVAGQIGRAAGTASRAIDPIALSLQGAKALGKGAGYVGSKVAGVTTGAGGMAVREAGQAGFEGGARGAALTENMRGAAPLDDVITDAKAALDQVKQARSQAYNAGMAGTRADTAVLDINAIDSALQGTQAQYTFKGVSKNPAASAAIEKIAMIIDEWKQLDPKEFHTAEGFDALKQRVGSVLDTLPYEQRAARAVASQVYNVVKSQITKQAPEYAKTMKGYEEASTLIREMEKTLSLNPKASVDTTLRKLQSVMRNNVNTNYGKRLDLVKMLEANGAQHLLTKLAGQQLSSAAPRGLARLGTQGALTAGIGMLEPSFLASLPLQSPRLVGEAAYAGGRAANALSRVPARNSLMVGYQSRGANNR